MRFGEHRYIMCIGCLETRLDRQLHSGDFTPAPINDPTDPHISPRLRARLLAMPDWPPEAERVISCLLGDEVRQETGIDPRTFDERAKPFEDKFKPYWLRRQIENGKEVIRVITPDCSDCDAGANRQWPFLCGL
jgi:hypothetical protein